MQSGGGEDVSSEGRGNTMARQEMAFIYYSEKKAIDLVPKGNQEKSDIEYKENLDLIGRAIEKWLESACHISAPSPDPCARPNAQ